MTAIAELDERLSADLTPARKPRSPSVFARALRLPDGPSGPRDGQPGDLWVPETEPTQAAFNAQLDAGRFRRYVIVAPSQRGKTLKAILSPMLHAVAECKQSFGFVLPSMDKLSQAWDGKLKPAIEGTGFSAWLPTHGPGSKGGRPPMLTMRDPATGRRAGNIYFMAMGTGGRETQVSMVSPQKLGIDEADDAESAGQILLTSKRVDSWGKLGRVYIASTVNDRAGRDASDKSDPDSSHPILLLYKEGSRHRQHHRCPHCAAYCVIDFEQIDPERQCVTCPKCATLWSEGDRRDALNRSLSVGAGDRIELDAVVPGDYTGTNYSELTTATDYHMTVFPDLCGQILAAKQAEVRGDCTLMRTLMHKSFCRSYVEPAAANEITNQGLASLSARSDYDKRTVPHWVTHLSCGVDVQGDRVYWIAVGHGPDDRWCVIDWGYEMAVPKEQDRAPTPADRRRILAEVDAKMNAGWRVEGRADADEARTMAPLHGLRAIDVGFATDELVSWLRGVKGWRACRGIGRDTIRHLGKVLDLPPEAKAFVELRQPEGWPVHLCNVNGENVRRWIHASLLRNPYDPASGMVPRGLKSNDVLCLHLSGEVETVDKDGRAYWREVRARHDLLDALGYAIGLSRLRNGIQTVNAARAHRRIGVVSNYLENM